MYPEDGDLPVQEDETALVIWALWNHFDRFRNIETIKPLYRPLIIRAANWMCEYRDPSTGLPRPSYDLWEVRYGIHAWTLGTVYGGLRAAANFARAFGETDLADKFSGTAEEIKTATTQHLWQESLGRFVRTVYRVEGGTLEPDPTLDSSLCGLYRFGMYEPSDSRIASTLNAMKDRLWVKSDVGGMARHDGDWYHQVSTDTEHVPGNPWFVCTAWLAQWYIAQAEDADQLEPAREVLHWMRERALPSGVLAEQVNPYTDQPLSVSPLTWSHAEYVIAVIDYVDKAAALGACAHCGLPLRQRRPHASALEKDMLKREPVGPLAPGSA
jgi:GH15 family glucan-1,4-alpha-glucosidase